MSKYVLLFRHQNKWQNHDMKTANRCLENVSQYKYLGTTLTNQNLIQEEIKKALNSCNACYHSVQNLMSSRLQSEYVKIGIRIQKYHFASCSVSAWNLVSDVTGGTQAEGVWGKYLDRREMKWWEATENCVIRSFIISSIVRMIKSTTGWEHVARMGRRWMHTGLRKKVKRKDLDVGWTITLHWILQKQDEVVWTGLFWSGGLLWTR
jgi:hypothetical protein